MNVSSLFYDRLRRLQELLNISSGRQFVEKLGISNENLMSYKRGGQPSLGKLVDILTNVEGLNPDWLIMGKPPVFIDVKLNKTDISLLLNIMESQQRTIEMQQQTINTLIKEKNDCAKGA